MLRAEDLKTAIEGALPGSVVHVEDTKGTGDHFQAIVVSPEFVGKSLVQQHQLVYTALEEQVSGDLHALGLKTYTPEAWSRTQPRLG